MRLITKPFDWISALFCVPAFPLIVLGLGNLRAFPAGLQNAPPPFIIPEIFFFSAGAILEIVGLIFILVTWSRSSRPTKIFGTIVAGLPLLIIILLLLFPLHAYRHGFAHWAAKRVKPEVLRAWVSAKDPVSASASAPFLPQYDLKDLPGDISALLPRTIAPQSRGVTMEWGTGDLFGGPRSVYVTLDPKDTAPPDDSGTWLYAAPGVFVTN